LRIGAIASHRGDWHGTADRLRAWLETWWKPTPVTRRLRESNGTLVFPLRE